MKLYDESTKGRLLLYGLGLGTGLLCLMLPPKVEYREHVTTQTVVKEVEKKVNVVRYKDKWRDRVITTTKPDGTKIVVVDKSGEKDKTDAQTDTHSTSTDDRRDSDITRFARNRYGLGFAYAPLRGDLYIHGAMRLGDTPLLLTLSPGSVGVTLTKFNWAPTVGVQVEF